LLTRLATCSKSLQHTHASVPTTGCMRCTKFRCSCWYEFAVQDLCKKYCVPSVLVHLLGSPHRLWHFDEGVARRVCTTMKEKCPRIQQAIVVARLFALVWFIAIIPFRRDRHVFVEYYKLCRPTSKLSHSKIEHAVNMHLRHVGFK
jgi:hypothetical protein